MIEKINELKQTMNKIKEDNIITPKEVDFLQDWVDENSVEFCENKEMSNVMIILQKVLDDGEISTNEIDILNKLLESVK